MRRLVTIMVIWTPPLEVPQFHAAIKITSGHPTVESVGQLQVIHVIGTSLSSSSFFYVTTKNIV